MKLTKLLLRVDQTILNNILYINLLLRNLCISLTPHFNTIIILFKLPTYYNMYIRIIIYSVILI